MSNNHFSGRIFEDGSINRNIHMGLFTLDLGNNEFSGKIFTNLPPALVYFDGSNNQFDDSKVTLRLQCVKLTHVRFQITIPDTAFS
jgi:hypothetical protein